ncbi:hypothetical protein FQR65_LT10524 [Abscondita terminalis]|nr:hypothetical protein FQR65_LT10524 [Abscondita terminalis]
MADMAISHYDKLQIFNEINDTSKGFNKTLKRWKRFDWIPARLILYFLALNGLAITFAMRVVINLTILAMVKEKPADLYLNATETLCYGYKSNVHAEPIGLTWPAMYSAISVWIPISERSRFVTCFQGLYLGIVGANLMSGFIIVTFGWVYVFYCTGACGLVNALAWYFLMHDKPEDHPRISTQELEYIQQNREECLHTEKQIPWISILKSIPVWASGIAGFGRMWTNTFFTIYGPLYLKNVIGLSVESNGVWMAVSSLVSFLSALFFSYVADQLVAYKVTCQRCTCISVWIPISERSRFVTCFQGLYLGIVGANLMSGFIIVTFGWVYVFYCTGACGLVNALAWYFLMHDKPEDHPRISTQELEYIQQNREECLHTEKQIPWISILKSIPVWASGIAGFGRMWTNTFFTIYGPLYLKNVIGLSVESNGVWMAVSSLVSFLSALFFSYVADQLVAYKVMKIGYNRKLFVFIGLVVPGIMIVTMDYMICNITLFIVLWLLNQSFFAASFQGYMTNIVDVAPTYAGPVICVVQEILLASTLLCPVVIKIFLQNENSLQSWKNIFYTNNGVALSASILYIIFASGKVQQWDFAKNSSNLRDRKAMFGLLRDDELN